MEKWVRCRFSFNGAALGIASVTNTSQRPMIYNQMQQFIEIFQGRVLGSIYLLSGPRPPNNVKSSVPTLSLTLLWGEGQRGGSKKFIFPIICKQNSMTPTILKYICFTLRWCCCLTYLITWFIAPVFFGYVSTTKFYTFC